MNHCVPTTTALQKGDLSPSFNVGAATHRRIVLTKIRYGKMVHKQVIMNIGIYYHQICYMYAVSKKIIIPIIPIIPVISIIPIIPIIPNQYSYYSHYTIMSYDLHEVFITRAK